MTISFIKNILTQTVSCYSCNERQNVYWHRSSVHNLQFRAPITLHLLVVCQLQYHLAVGIRTALDPLHKVLSVVDVVKDLDVGRGVEALEEGCRSQDPLLEIRVHIPIAPHNVVVGERRRVLQKWVTFSS
jgi:hypothetical protein